MIWIDGEPVVPTFRAERGTSNAVWSEADGGLVRLMHPFDVAQALAEQGQITQAFAALDGFLLRYLDILEDNALQKLTLLVIEGNLDT